jgi:hypothetical protein
MIANDIEKLFLRSSQSYFCQTHNATIINSKPSNEVRKYDGTLGYYFAQSSIVYGDILCFLDGRE